MTVMLFLWLYYSSYKHLIISLHISKLKFIVLNLKITFFGLEKKNELKLYDKIWCLYKVDYSRIFVQMTQDTQNRNMFKRTNI